MKGIWRSGLFGALALLFCAPPAATAADQARITVFAAASLTDVLTDIAKTWHEAGHPEIILSFAASSKLAKQIEQGAPADIFASADVAWMNYLAERQQIEVATIKTQVRNSLVWIAPPGTPIGTDNDPLLLLGEGRIAMADPESVPAGMYAKQALMNMGLWDKVAGRLAPAENVRAALALVENGEAPLGIVYATDVRKSDVRIVAAIPLGVHDPIDYPMGIVAGHGAPEVRAFFEFVTGPAGRDTFRDYGFLVQAPSS